MRFDSLNRVLMARVEGTFTFADLVGINDDAAAFVAKEGSVRFVCDLRGVEAVDIEASEFVSRAQRTAVLPVADRVYVAADPLLFGLCRQFASHQRNAGNHEPVIASSLEEAYRVLKLVEPDFQPIPLA